jgi:sodium transport system permease protein
VTTARFLRQLLVVFRKELRDSSRDRRAILAIVVGVLVGPAVIGFMVNQLAERQRQAEYVRLPVVGIANAPAFVGWLRTQWGVTVVEGPRDPERAVRDGDEDVVLVIPPDFAERFSASRAAPVSLVSDGSRDASTPQVKRVRDLLARYSSEIATLRLVAHGVSPQVVTTIRVDEVEVSTAQQRAASILNFLGLFMLMSALTGGVQLATDSTAGERERGSLESLLVNPVPRGALVGGKWLAASAASLIAVVLSMGFCAGLLKLVLAPDIGVRIPLGATQMGTILLAALSVCPLSSALQLFVGTYSRSFKEAQSYIGILMTLPVMAIAVLGAIYPLRNELWMYAIPLLSQYTMVTSAIGGTPPNTIAYLIATAVSLIAAGLLVALTTRLFRSERIVFGR